MLLINYATRTYLRVCTNKDFAIQCGSVCAQYKRNFLLRKCIYNETLRLYSVVKLFTIADLGAVEFVKTYANNCVSFFSANAIATLRICICQGLSKPFSVVVLQNSA